MMFATASAGALIVDAPFSATPTGPITVQWREPRHEKVTRRRFATSPSRGRTRPRHVPEVVLEVDRVVAFEVLNRLHAEQNCFYAGTDDSLVREVLHGYVHWHIPAGTLSQVCTKA